MKKAALLHNPTAGDNDFSKKQLIKLIEGEGFGCAYASVKEEGWDQFEDDTDFLAIAGGDGTVRRVAKALMKRKLLDKQFPLALLPHGTANNIACALGIDGEAQSIIQRWHHYHLKPMDVGKVHGLRDDLFFLEGLGLGIFPKLMKEMGKVPPEHLGETVPEKLNVARNVLCDLVSKYEAKPCTIIADGTEHTGNFLMVEVLNIRSIGPNLVLAANADPGDGEFEVVLVTEDHRKRFQSFLQSHIDGEVHDFNFTTIHAKHVKIMTDWKDLHVDDERIKIEAPVDIEIEILPGMLNFIITE
ncbi:diacylglycerol/lipid kinase family protein [Dyadobacter luticola]|uniref:Diacylglycerol kinase n=1 Tax=Dyadobacter luticola TaxID=1979387 RepID=A0A5R9L2H9_9BACT|nr:diacylglycerol kinase family protein [Dyadobacter luticola]TLV02766.1 diacylglycerol kinase [Dyadobacter luticola]